jgi:excisionase family DNA binding protein
MEQQQNQLLTVDELAKYLKISRPKAYQLVHQEGFPKIKLGKSIRIPMQALDNWITAQYTLD